MPERLPATMAAETLGQMLHVRHLRRASDPSRHGARGRTQVPTFLTPPFNHAGSSFGPWACVERGGVTKWDAARAGLLL